MTTATVHNDIWPSTRTMAALFLANAAAHLKELGPIYLPGRVNCFDRDYDDRKASQLLEAKSDLVLAEVRIDSWQVDLGFRGCTVGE